MIFKSFKQCNIAPNFHCTIALLLFSSLSTGRVTMGSLTCFPTNMAMIHQQHISKIMFVALKLSPFGIFDHLLMQLLSKIKSN
jgi:hypothetical protein